MSQLPHVLHGHKQVVLGDAGYRRTERTLDAAPPDHGPRILTPFRRAARCNRELAALRAKFEHPFE